MSSESVVKGDHVDPLSRIELLISGSEPKIRKAFLGMVSFLKNSQTKAEIADLLQFGRIEEALALVESSARSFGAVWSTVFTGAGEDTASFFGNRLGVLINFDRTSTLAVREMQFNQLRITNAIIREQVSATRLAISMGLRRGASPIEQADIFVQSIGLTTGQVTTVGRYRNLLETLNVEALRRELRDKSFDSEIQSAIRNRDPLTSAQVDQMVGKYEESLLSFRAGVIARSESLAASGAGVDDMYRQAMEAGFIDPASVEKKWKIRNDGKVRDPAHARMRNQVRDFFTPFRSGIGGLLRFPADPSATAADTANCRCRVEYRFSS